MKTRYSCYVFIAYIIFINTTNAQTGSWKLAGNNLTGTEVLGSKNNFDLKFISNNVQRMTLTGSGRFRVGSSFGSVASHTLFQTGGRVLITDNPSMVSEPLLELSAFNNNCVQWYKIFDTLKAVSGFDQSTNDFVISTQNPGISPDFIINRGNGFTGLNTKTPQERLHVVGNELLDGDLIMASTLGKGDINFTTDQQNIAFAAPGLSSSAMIYLSNASSSNRRMIFAKDNANGSTGLNYEFGSDVFNFIKGGISKLRIDLTNGRIGINDNTPTYSLDVTGNTQILGNIGVQTAPNSRTIQCGSTQGALIGIGTAEYIQDAGANTLSFAASLIPTNDGSFALGSSSNRWSSVWAVDGTINTSDARDKNNIRDLNYGLKEILQLHPVKFNWKNNPAEGDKLGVIAQEIQKVLPEVVRDWEYQIDETTGKKTKVSVEKLGVMYADIIPVLIRGMQEQQNQIDELKQLVDQLTNTQTSASSVNNVAISNAALEQNVPNPVKNTTTIRYNITGNTAQLNITDGNGKIIKQIQLAAKGVGIVNVDCSALGSGAYYYSLLADGKIIDTKKMIVTK